MDVAVAGPRLRAWPRNEASPGDEELVARMAGGDTMALGTLYDRWSPLVFSLAARLLGPEDAETVVEETFWEAWRQARQHAGRRSTVQGWLLGIGWTRTVALYRARERSRGGSPAPVSEPLGPVAAAREGGV